MLMKVCIFSSWDHNHVKSFPSFMDKAFSPKLKLGHKLDNVADVERCSKFLRYLDTSFNTYWEIQKSKVLQLVVVVVVVGQRRRQQWRQRVSFRFLHPGWLQKNVCMFDVVKQLWKPQTFPNNRPVGSAFLFDIAPNFDHNITGAIGLLASFCQNYVWKMHSPRPEQVNCHWYTPNITRAEAEALLKEGMWKNSDTCSCPFMLLRKNNFKFSESSTALTMTVCFVIIYQNVA